MKFHSKKGPVVGVLVWAFILGLFGIAVHDTFFAGEINLLDLFVIIVFLLAAVYFAWVWFQTYYEVEENALIIVSGPKKKKINIQDIESIKRTLNPLTGPALSMDRMSIKYGPYQSVLVSPKEKKAFIDAILKQNPKIHVEFKPTKEELEKL